MSIFQRADVGLSVGPDGRTGAVRRLRDELAVHLVTGRLIQDAGVWLL